ncbi:LysR family transcriptional regulator [Patulibacter defluvii]|uniref:LysR family transcriptional regulator n=1 Tax=Patulibacter defluvii TaxID=3095358 RepID=UPI002A749AF5|nr:LysR family transcriptional regulator [Patulibacter sp. DM4]
MDVLHLRVLREIARRGSISAAADALDYTQPAVSRQLAALERAAGRPLVERTARGTRLTTAGEVLLQRAETILGELEAAQADLLALADGTRMPLRVAAVLSTIATFVPVAVTALRARIPGLDVTLRIAANVSGESALQDDRLDVAVLSLVGDERLPGARVVPLLDDPLWCVLPRDHPLAEADAVAVEALRNEPWVMTAATLCADRGVLVAACEAAGFRPHAVAHCDDAAASQGLVAAGVGVAAIPQLCLTQPRDDVAIRPFRTPVVRRIAALTPLDAPVRPGRDALLEELAAAAERVGRAPAAAAAGQAAVRPSQAESGSPVIRS